MKKNKKSDNLEQVADKVMEDSREKLKRSQQELYENFGYQDGVYKVNGKLISEDSLDDAIERGKENPEDFARDFNIDESDVPLALAFMEDLKNAKTPEEIAAVYDKYPPHIVDPVTDKLEEDSQFDLERVKQAELNESNVEANNDLSQAEINAEVSVKNSTMDEWDSLGTGNSISVAEQVSSSSESKASSVKLNTEYNMVAQGEVVSISNTAELDNSAAYQVPDNDINVNKPIEITIG